MSRKLKIAGAAGIVTPILVFIMILGAIASWPSFNWVNNALSDLGVQWGITASLFNAGLVIGGLLFIIFVAGLFENKGKKIAGKIGSGFFFLACIALVLIGVFNETFIPTHYIVSVMLFVSLPISLFAFVVEFWQLNNRKLGVFTLALSLVAASPWLIQFALSYVPNVAIPETISGLAGSAWTMVLGFIMLKDQKKI